MLLMVGITRIAFSATATLSYTSGDIAACGVGVATVNLNVHFNMCPGSNCDHALCSIGNPFRATVKLYRSGGLVETRQFNLSSEYFNEAFTNIQVTGGAPLYATVQFERKKNACVSYETIANATSNTWTIPVFAATPNFNINGTAIPANYAPMEVCGSNIKINASTTTCERSYNIAIEECDQWLTRSNQYTVSKWFNGEAPDNFNLQSFAALYSDSSAYFIGDPARMGDILFGGNLPNGTARYYLVKVCTDIPSWDCKSALVRILNCKPGRDGMQDEENSGVLEEKITALALSSNKGSVSIVKNSSDRINVYPNPASNEVSFHVSTAAKDLVTIFIYDIKGNRVLDVVKNALTIDGENVYRANLGSLQTGMYFYKVKTNNTTYNGKLIKQ